MKKIKNILADLSTVMLITTSAINIAYAESIVLGDANNDGNLDIRDCAYISGLISQNKKDKLPSQSDYNRDNCINIRDAAAISKKLALEFNKIYMMSEDIQDFIVKNDLDAYVSLYSEQNKNYVEVEYINEEVRAAIEEYITSKNYNKNSVRFCLSEDKSDFICRSINNFITDNHLNAQVFNKQTYYNINSEIIVNYYYTHTDVKPLVEKFIAEKKYSPNMIGFQAVGSENSGASEKITNVYEIIALLYDFIKEKHIYASMDINEFDIDCFEITLNDYWDKTDNQALIEAFMKEKNIDTSLVHILQLD